MHRPATVKVSKRYQITLPSAARNSLHIEAGDSLVVEVQDGIIVLVPQPDSYSQALEGLDRNLGTGAEEA